MPVTRTQSSPPAHAAVAAAALMAKVPTEAIAKAVMADVTKIQHRKTRDLRVEDGIKSVSVADGSLLVTLKPGQPYDKKNIEHAVADLAKEHGIARARISVVDTLAPEKAKKQTAVDESWFAISNIQHRLTADLRAEDDVVGLNITGPDTVNVSLKAHARFNDVDIKEAVVHQLEAHGWKGAKIEFTRPAIDPIFIHPPAGPVTGGLTIEPGPMKAKVTKLNETLQKVHHRMTEEIRVEDGVKSVAIKGATVVITVQDSAVDPDRAAEWAKAELKKLGVTLPVVVKGLDTVPAAESKIAKALYQSLNDDGAQLQATPAGSEPKFDDKKGAFVSYEGNAMFSVRLRFPTGGAPMPTTTAFVDPTSNSYYTRTDDPMGRTGSKWEGPQLLPDGARFSGGHKSLEQVKKLGELAEKGVPHADPHGPPRP